jgi:basic membrane protein A
VISCLLALGLALGGTACAAGRAPARESGSAPRGNAPTHNRVGLVFDVGGRGDGSFNDAAAAGLERAATEFGLQTTELTPDRGATSREELLRMLSEQGYGLVVAVGLLFADALRATAPDFPATRYAILDSVVPGDNIVSLTFASEQGSFLVGAAAALKSRTGRLGFLGGVETDLIRRFEAGYVAGARHVNPGVRVDVKYISQPPDFTGFSDPARAREIALGLYDAGADVVYHAAGGSGRGLFEAAREASSRNTKVWAIGVDSDQYQTVEPALRPFILTSMLKRVDQAVYEAVRDFQASRFRSGEVTFDLAAGGVGYSRSGGALADVEPELQSLEGQIVRREIAVPGAL